MKKIINTITESGLLVLLFLIIFAAAVSVISLSPEVFETQGSVTPQEQVAGVTGSASTTFSPYLAKSDTFFLKQSLEEDLYSTQIVFQKLEAGENKIDIINVTNIQGYKYFEVKVGIEEAEKFEVYVLIGGERTFLSPHIKEGKTDFRFEMKKSEVKDIALVIISQEQVNFPVEMNFSIRGLR